MNVCTLVVAVFFTGMGLAALYCPYNIWKPFGVEPDTPEARNEVRAVYGGFGCAIAVLLVLTDDSATLRDGVLVTVAASVFGMGAGRVVSGLLEPRALLGWPGFFLLVEVGLGGLCLLAR